MPTHPIGFGATIGLGGCDIWKDTPRNDFQRNKRLDELQRRAYIENVGHEPPVPRSEEMAEQWAWPNAKLRKYNRLTLEQVMG